MANDSQLLRSAEKEIRVARDRELKAQLAESATKDVIRAAIAVLDDMSLDGFEREMKVRAMLSSALF